MKVVEGLWSKDVGADEDEYRMVSETKKRYFQTLDPMNECM